MPCSLRGLLLLMEVSLRGAGGGGVLRGTAGTAVLLLAFAAFPLDLRPLPCGCVRLSGGGGLKRAFTGACRSVTSGWNSSREAMAGGYGPLGAALGPTEAVGRADPRPKIGAVGGGGFD